MNLDRKLKLKIRNGTRSGKRLCDTCSHGQIMRGEAESEEIVLCNFSDMQVPIKVVECSNYEDKLATPLHEMKALAWMVRTDKTGHQIGFVSPERWRALVRAKEVIDDDE